MCRERNRELIISENIRNHTRAKQKDERNISSVSGTREVDYSAKHINSSWDNPESSFLRCDAEGTTSRRIDTDENFCYLVETQIKESFCQVEDGLTALLAKCLESDSKNAVLSSHLLKLRQEAREVLYGGFGFIPDISSLQRWLEIAWERGVVNILAFPLANIKGDQVLIDWVWNYVSGYNPIQYGNQRAVFSGKP
ncbi:unnamed protein product [Fraxinus pennsylvanica]|uniref:Uncharacterized protein n=1 Tax=Fraxinus pennsylvanica TaxID=56036 RepID=A0AAD2E486_9LAMI|nr:unnamed protein product [Fraxinus pennsylvanica]